jgi:hypothetical protein
MMGDLKICSLLELSLEILASIPKIKKYVTYIVTYLLTMFMSTTSKRMWFPTIFLLKGTCEKKFRIAKFVNEGFLKFVYQILYK